MRPTSQRAGESLMVGTKTEGRGNAAFHASIWQKGFGNFARCGSARLGALVPASTIPAELRCRSKACQAAFKDAGI